MTALRPPRLLPTTSITLPVSLVTSLVPKDEFGSIVPWIVIGTFVGGLDVMSPLGNEF